MKIRYLIACLTVVAAGCADDSSDVATTITETKVDLASMPTEPKFVCTLIVSCEDGTKVNESVSTESECGALREKGKAFDYSQCSALFEKKQLM